MQKLKKEDPLKRIYNRLDVLIDELSRLKAEVADSMPDNGPRRSRRSKFVDPTTGETFTRTRQTVARKAVRSGGRNKV